MYESTRDQVRRALEANGVVLLNSARGEGVMIVHAAAKQDQETTA
ncbi:outer membrane lipopolysaccharide assembly protein LptE/RlpB [Amorphus sp. MBR-141]